MNLPNSGKSPATVGGNHLTAHFIMIGKIGGRTSMNWRTLQK
jgi:hypothetical protein